MESDVQSTYDRIAADPERKKEIDAEYQKLLTTEKMLELIEKRNLHVLVDYFGSSYHGVVTKMEERKDGTYFLTAVDPRKLGLPHPTHSKKGSND